MFKTEPTEAGQTATQAVAVGLALLLAVVMSACGGPSEPGPPAETQPCLDARVVAPAHPFSADRLRARRSAVLESIRPGVAIWSAGWSMGEADGDPHREDSEFYYLTGLEETAAWLVMVAAETGDDQIILYVDTTAARSSSTVRARDVIGLADVRCMTDGFDELPEMIEPAGSPARAGRLYLSELVLDGTDPKVLAAVDTTGIVIGLTGPHLEQPRTIKDSDEQARLRHAAEITAAALSDGIRTTSPGEVEAETESVIEAAMLSAGAARMSFPSIVASGANALSYHYSLNTAVMEAGDLVLIDVGAEYGRYTGDVTRTIPISGQFSERQRALYELVLGTQQAAVDAAGPGLTLHRLEEIARAYMHDASGDLCGRYTCDVYFGHRLSHHLGLDVHDIGSTAVQLQPGMVFTIEPGIYLSAEGIGIRIEDDYLVTSTGVELLSTGLPSTIADIEALMSGGSASRIGAQIPSDGSGPRSEGGV